MGEVRMLIDGELAEAGSGKRFANVNPATEEILGEVTDADAADMTRAIGAARRAFDRTDWSTNRALRKRCLQQLQDALVSEQEQLRQELVEEAGTPVMLTYGAQLDWPLADALTWPMEYIDEFEWERSLPISNQIGMPSRRGVYKEAIGVIGAIVPWNFPVEVTLNKLGPILATGNTCVLKPAPDTPFNATRLGRLVAEHTDFPPGCSTSYRPQTISSARCSPSTRAWT
jgi:aldehyde dehydrogenase (NAD+)